MSSPFVHLHTHSHYSLLEALPKIKNLIAHIKTLNMDAVALTDNGTMYGMIEFYQKALEAGVKPILGVDFYLAREGRQQKRAHIDAKPFRLVCLAETNEGYRNLIALSSIGFLEGFYYKPRIDKDLLAEHTKGLIALSGGHLGEIDDYLQMGNREAARTAIQWYVRVFGEGHFFLELVDRPEIAQQQSTNAQLIELGRELGVPLVVTKNAFYVRPEENEAWKILNCIKGGKTLEHLERVGQFDYDASLISGEEIEKRFSDVPDAIENTRRIADRCKVELELGKWNFARYVIPEGKTFRQVLEEEASIGLEAKEGVLTDEQLQRLNYEIEIIDQKGFCPYFLIVSDFLRWARAQGIVTTTRGSAAGSIVGYAVGISAINPLVYELPFERFLNPERPSAPDIDADFADNRRDEVLEYVRQKYGTEKVAQICTFGSMLARGSVRDVGRALGFPYKMVDEISKLVPFGSQGFPMTLDRALQEAPELKKKYDRDEHVKRIIDLARRIEGCGRHVSIHAAGTVIAPTALMDFTPLQIDTREGKMITQYEMKSVESAGLVKIDFLGIRNLSILGDAVALVKKTKGVEIDIERVPLDDTKTFELLSHGHTMGVFQLGGDGMTKYLIDLKPERVQDIMAMVALYRPGPIESIPEYIKRKHDPSLVRFLDPRMKDILSKSYGVLVYQDDVMLIAIQLAGYSWLEADKLRKAMGKKIPEEMAKQKEKLIDGLVEHGMSKQKANELWKLVEPFAAYGFNKCLAGDTKIYDPKTGLCQSIQVLFESQQEGFVMSMDPSFRLVESAHLRVHENGIKQIYQLKTRSGRQIRATANHPFFAFEGWKRLDALSLGDRIAVPRGLPAGPGIGIDFRKIRTLGYLIAEGNLCHSHGGYFYSKSQIEINDFIHSVQVFENIACTIDRSKSAVSVYLGQKNQKKGNRLRMWLDELGVLGKKATEKCLPNIVYQFNENELSELIAALWQGDGSVSEKWDGSIFYATSSETLAYQLQHLLLRLRIFSTIHAKQFVYRGGFRHGFTLHISNKEQIERFAEMIGCRLLKNKQIPLQKLLAHLKLAYAGTGGIIARGTKDVIPAVVLDFVRDEMTRSDISLNEMSSMTGLSNRLFSVDHRRIGYRRTVIQWIADALDSSLLHHFATSDIYWDEIISITSDGKEMTYDVEVPKQHNFVANDIIVHNSHACSYGMIAYETAYMKANFPAEYMTALMTAESGDLEKIAEAVKECERLGIKVLPPDVNESGKHFTYIDDTHIRFGLLVIKNLGEEVVETMIRERESSGVFISLWDLMARVSHRAFNKKSLEALIKSGALDRFGERKQFLENMDRLLLYHKQVQQEKELNQQSLFAFADSEKKELPLRPTPAATMQELLAWEKELLGLYISSHPFFRVRERLQDYLVSAKDLSEKTEQTFVRVGGVIEAVKTIVTKKGDPMAFVKLDDGISSLECVCFPRVFTTLKDQLQPGAILIVSGKISKRENESPSVLMNQALCLHDQELETLAQLFEQGVWFPLDGIVLSESKKEEPAVSKSLSIVLKGKPEPEIVSQMRKLLESFPGSYRVCLLVESGGRMRTIETDYRVKPSDELLQEIGSLVGPENVRVS